MSGFKPGDRVLCISGNSDVTVGKVYTVDYTAEPFVYVTNGEWTRGGFSDRFELVEEPEDKLLEAAKEAYYLLLGSNLYHEHWKTKDLGEAIYAIEGPKLIAEWTKVGLSVQILETSGEREVVFYMGGEEIVRMSIHEYNDMDQQLTEGAIRD